MEETFTIGPPEFVGAFPVRQDVTVLPADDPGRQRINWVVHEYAGTEAFDLSGFFKAGGRIGDISELPEGGWHEDWSIWKIVDEGLEVQFLLPGIRTGKTTIPTATRQGLTVGDRLVVCGLIGFDVATVTEVNGDSALAESSGSLWPLEFSKDDRKCWVCTCQMNKSLFNSNVNLSVEE